MICLLLIFLANTAISTYQIVVISQGDYVKDLNAALTADFYNKDTGLRFDGVRTYKKGNLTTYTWFDDNLTLTEADILMNETYNNVQCRLCSPNPPKANPSHDMSEEITINSSKIRYYEEGLGSDDSETLRMAIDANAIKYTINTGYIPLDDMPLGGDYIDMEYRGKMMFFGKEYYVKDVTLDKIYLSKGMVLDDVSSEGYFIEYHDYKFRVNSLVYDENCTNEILSMVVDVKKPDETVVEVQCPVNKSGSVGVVDDFEIIAISGNIINDSLSVGAINVTNTSSGSSVLLDINSTGYVTQWGYSFKVNRIITDCMLAKGINLYVEKPDGSIVETQVSKMANGLVDDMEIGGIYGELVDDVELASIIVYDTTTEVVLEDSEDIEVDGIEYEGWKVKWRDYAKNCSELACGIADYANSSADVLEKIEVTFTDDVTGVDALKVDESLSFPGRFRLKFMGFLDDELMGSDCSGGCPITLEKDTQDYRLRLNFTADNGMRYGNIRLDEGPFYRAEVFILDGELTRYRRYTKTKGPSDKDDNVTVLLTTPIDRDMSSRTITLNRLCDPDGVGGSSFDDCTVGGKPTCDCSGIPDLKLRLLALTDAMDDTTPSEYENDYQVTLDLDDLFWAQDSATDQDLVIWFDASSSLIFYSTDKNDTWITVEPKMVSPGASSTNDTYKIDYFDLENRTMWVMRECDLANDVNATSLNLTCDLNNDTKDSPATTGNDDDLLVIFESGSGNEYMVLDLTDRGYNEGHDYRHDNRIGLYSNWSNTNRTENANNLIGVYDEDIFTVMVTPSNGDRYTIDWGVDNEIEEMGICYLPRDTIVGRGLDVHQLTIDFTGEEGNRYEDIRLDEGLFSKGDWFILDGKVIGFDGYDSELGIFDKDDNFTITLELQNTSKRTVKLNRLCDPLSSDNNSFENCSIGGTPTCGCLLMDDLKLRLIALYDAMEDSLPPAPYENDYPITLEPEDLFWAQDSNTAENLVLWFDESGNIIFYSTDENDTRITIEPKMVNPGASSTNDTHKIGSSGTRIWVTRECDFMNDVNATSENASCDWNNDGAVGTTARNDDDLLVIFESEKGEYVVADYSDRGYNEGASYKFKNSLGLYSNFTDNASQNSANEIVVLDEDTDNLLITPLGGGEYTIDWGVDNKIDEVSLCHPEHTVNAAYFIGLKSVTTVRETAGEKVSTTANQTNIVNMSDIDVILELVTSEDATANVNATIYVNSTDYFNDTYFGHVLEPNLPASALGRYAEIIADSSVVNNLKYILIKVYYSDSEVTAAGLVESQLRLYRYDENTDTWVLLTPDLSWVFGSGVDTTNNFVWANTSRFSTYGIWEGTTTTTTTPPAPTTTRYYGGGGGGSGGGAASGAKVLPSCFDGILNCHDGDCETGIDCGGPCKPCPSCSDGIQNQGEEGVDCGGPCEPCKTTTTKATTTTLKTEKTTSTSTMIGATTTTVIQTTTTKPSMGEDTMTLPVIAIAGVFVVIALAVFLLKKK
ncbi:MAG: hypothetical protein JW778_03955 [Candidatus Altiarchaeota archaeon]|nr:hypothetical protein [Candidatus Altiarchaeota archaeon]